MSETPATDEQLERAISDLQARRAILGDAVVDPAVAALREQLGKLAAPKTGGDDERKIVTVMFADLSGFTQLAEQMEAEEARGLVNSCFEVFVPVVQSYGGTVDKFLGDAIMVLFGAPIAHENDPERALRAALELIEALRRFNGGRNLTLGLHIGINTGPVVAGRVGAVGRQDYSVMGDTVNVAARLEDACGENEILVGSETFRQTAKLFDFEILQPLQLKGKSQPLPAYRLVSSKASGTENETSSLRTPLCARRDELGEIKSAIERLGTGQGTMVCIFGEAGLGKSRLVSEARALRGSAFWAETHALSYAETTGYRMARDLLHVLLEVQPSKNRVEIDQILKHNIQRFAAADFAQIYPYLARVLEVPLETSWQHQIEQLNVEILQTRILEAFGIYIKARAEKEKLILVWEDIHWADPSSLQVLEELAGLISTVPVIIMAVCRPEGNAQTRMRQLAAKLPKGCARGIELRPLTTQESSGFLQAAGSIGDPEIRQTILTRAEGNPFFLEELVRAVRDARVRSVHDLSDIPQTLQAVVAARIDSLAPAAKRVLQRAAVIGRTFSETILAHVCDQSERRNLEEALEELCRRNFIEPEQIDFSAASDRRYVFHHAITQEVAYQGLLHATRRKWHRVTGEAIEALSPDQLHELSGILGRHFEKAGVRDKAVAYFVRAAERARAVFSNLEAIDFYRSALSQTEGTLEMARGVSIRFLHESLGDVLILNGQFEAAHDELERAHRLVGEDRVSRSRLGRKLGATWVHRREYEKGFADFDRAQKELESEASELGADWWNEWVQIQHERMHLFYWLGRCSELNALAAVVEPQLEKHGTTMQRGKFFMMRALSLLSEHRYAPPPLAAEFAERAVAITSDSDSPTDLVHLKFVLGLVRLFRGTFASSISELNDALEMSERVGDLVLQVRCLTYLAVAHRQADQPPLSRDYAERATALAGKLGMVHYTAMAHATFAWLAWKGGDYPAVKKSASEALKQWHSMADPYGFDWMALWPLIAVAHAERNFDEAVTRLRALFGPNQHPLPEEVTLAVQKAIAAAGKRSGDVDHLIVHALDVARSSHQL